MGAYAQCAERLIERGFAAVPIMPGTKRPGHFVCGMWIGLSNWQRRFNGGPPPYGNGQPGRDEPPYPNGRPYQGDRNGRPPRRGDQDGGYDGHQNGGYQNGPGQP